MKMSATQNSDTPKLNQNLHKIIFSTNMYFLTLRGEKENLKEAFLPLRRDQIRDKRKKPKHKQVSIMYRSTKNSQALGGVKNLH